MSDSTDSIGLKWSIWDEDLKRNALKINTLNCFLRFQKLFVLSLCALNVYYVPWIFE